MNPTISRINRLKRNLPTAVASLLVLSSLLLTVSLANAQGSDYSINANPLTLCTNPGINAQSNVSVSSIGGFSGTVYLSASVSPSYANAPTLSGVPSNVTISSTAPASFTILFATTTLTPLYTYTIMVSGFSSGIPHQATIELAVDSACSVGGSIVSTSHPGIGSNLVIGIAIAGLIGMVAGSLVYANRRKNPAKA
jgi:hypothetical protein